MMGAVEGGVTGVIVKNVFDGVVSPRQLNFSVAVLVGAPAFANIASFIWTGLSHGRNKIRFLVALQIVVAALVAMVAFAPPSALGLAILLVAAVGARVCWSGVLILRSTVWRANYPRSIRATLAGRLSGIQAITMTLTIIAIGAAVEYQADSYRVLFPLAGLFGLAGAWLYSRVRMRRHQTLLDSERDGEHTSLSLVHPARDVRGTARRREVPTLHDLHVHLRLGKPHAHGANGDHVQGSFRIEPVRVDSARVRDSSRVDSGHGAVLGAIARPHAHHSLPRRTRVDVRPVDRALPHRGRHRPGLAAVRRRGVPGHRLRRRRAWMESRPS